jgi:hypothetical protein
VDENAAITPATKPKITYDAKGLVTSGDSLDETDLPTGINANKIGTGVVSTTEFEYLNGVTSAIQTQINSKQATLVSGTNIKTINGATVLGAGDITIAANPSGVAGAIQFSNGSAFASDAANFFWDDTNNRLGVGTNAPSATGHFKGSGSTSATTSLLVQNSAGTAALTVKDNLFIEGLSSANQLNFRFGPTNQGIGTRNGDFSIGLSDSTSIVGGRFYNNGTGIFWIDGVTEGASKAQNYPMIFGSRAAATGNSVGSYTTEENGSQSYFGFYVAQPSAQVVINSTTRGFLPPRMTTTQRNAIASPATGLQVFDSTMNATCEYNGTGWRVVSAGAQSIAASTAATTVDMSSGNVQNITLTASTTLTLSNATVGTYIMKLIQGGSGSYTVTWPAAVIWSGGTAPTLTTTVGKVDIVTLVFDGTNYYGTYSLNY